MAAENADEFPRYVAQLNDDGDDQCQAQAGENAGEDMLDVDDVFEDEASDVKAAEDESVDSRAE